MPDLLSPLSAARHARLARRFGVVALAIALVGTVVACGDGDGTSPPSGSATAGLVLLAGEPGAATITVHDGRGTGREVAAPPGSTAWISVGRGGTIIATLDDGTLRISDELRSDRRLTWTQTPGDDVELPTEPLAFAMWSPSGRRVAAIASDPASEEAMILTIVDPVGDASLLLPVPRRPLAAAPAWADDDRVLVQTSAGFALVDTATGDVAFGPATDLGGGISASIAADGSLVALADPAAGAVEVRELERWMSGAGGDPLVRLEGEGEIGALAFDRRAERLGVVWQQPDGPGTLVIYRRDDGWQEAARLTVAGESARAVIDWLP